MTAAEKPADSHAHETDGVPAPTAQQRFEAGVGTFGSIATFSLVNTALIHSGTKLIFVGTLGISRVLDVCGTVASDDGLYLVQAFFLALSVTAAAFFWGLGKLAGAGRAWPFYVAIGAYLLDGGVCLLIGDWIEVAFHGYLLLGLVDGLRALRQLDVVQGGAPSATAA